MSPPRGENDFAGENTKRPLVSQRRAADEFLVDSDDEDEHGPHRLRPRRRSSSGDAHAPGSCSRRNLGTMLALGGLLVVSALTYHVTLNALSSEQLRSYLDHVARQHLSGLTGSWETTMTTRGKHAVITESIAQRTSPVIARQQREKQQPDRTRAGPCSPRTLDVANLSLSEDHKHRFHTYLRLLGPLPPPVFKGEHTSLCDESDRGRRGWSYCLPISGVTTEPLCRAADRLDLLAPVTPDTRCAASVLHMAMVDVYEAIDELGGRPLLVYGTLLGAVRNGSTIPFTEDADIAYQLDRPELDRLRVALFDRGYHLFFESIWRVCVAPTHPLASRLYNPNRRLPSCCNIPYVDLYRMQEPLPSQDTWRLEKTHHNHTLPRDKVEPFEEVRINGRVFRTVADPIDFLIAEYGDDYMIPKPRRSRR